MDQTIRNLLRNVQVAPGQVQGKPSYFGFPSFGPSSSFNTTTPSSNTVFSYIFYITMFSFVLFIILVIVHYAYTPIFSFSSGDGGYIPLSSSVSDGQLIWTSEPPDATKVSDLTNVLPCGFTLSVDVFLDKDLTLSTMERMILYRGRTAVVPTDTNTLQLNYADSNFLIYLQNDTNDLVVSAITFDAATGTEYVESAPTILNVPIRQPFRITSVYLPGLLEVYMNGRFVGSRVLKAKPKQTSTQFRPPPDQFQQTVKILNVSYWARPLLAREIANAPPQLADTATFKPSDLSQCGA